MILWLMGLMLLSARLVWEWIDPIQPADFKGLFYLRDIATLFPTALCWYVASALNAHRLPRGLQHPLAVLWAGKWSARAGRATAVLATLLFLACVTLSVGVLRTRAHIVDEVAYLFQARIFADGRLWAAPPTGLDNFFALRYVVVTPTKWYSGFFPGQSLALLPGVLLGLPFLVNPVLSGVLLAVTVWAGSRLFDRSTGLLAGGLMLLSPLVLLQGASYFGHILTAIFFTIAVTLLLAGSSRPYPAIGIGLCGGAVLLCRPLSAALLAVYALGWWLQRMATGRSQHVVLRQLLLAGLGAAPALLLFLAYNCLLTGDALLTPHDVALPDERLGLGLHTLTNTAINGLGLAVDLLGVPLLALLPLAGYALVGDRRWLWSFASLVVLYMAGYGLYPYHGLSYGPRFYFEICPVLLIAAGRGLVVLADQRNGHGRIWRLGSYLGGIMLIANVVVMLCGVLPPRLWSFHQRAVYYDIRLLVESRVRPPALLFISGADEQRLTPFIAGFQLNQVSLDGPYIFARDLGTRNGMAVAAFPRRHIYTLDLDTRQVRLQRAVSAQSLHQGPSSTSSR